MKIRRSTAGLSPLLIGVSSLGLMLAACNRQPNTQTEAAMVAPPAAALPLAAGAPPAAAPAPPVDTLPAPPTAVSYAPPPPQQRYRYVDQAYAMGQAFADTPPDYTVDYNGTRPWIWRANDGAYRIVERLPRGDRYYYYHPGQDYPYYVQDPDYGYAYNGDTLVGVYDPDGAEVQDALAARRAEEAARYLYRARELYRAARYEQRQAAYADAWEQRRDDLRRQQMAWQQEQARNAQWRQWHEQNQAAEQQQWRQERAQRVAYASAIGIAAASAARPNPAELARRQAAYFRNWDASHGRPTGAQRTQSRGNPAPVPQASPSGPGGPNARVENRRIAQMQRAQAAQAQAKAAQAAQAQRAAAQTQNREAAAAHANAAQAARARQLAAQAQKRQAAAAQAKAAQSARAQKLAAQAKQHQAAAAQAKAAQAARAQKAAAQARQRQASAAQAKSAQAARAQKAAAAAKQRENAAAQAKAAQAQRAQKLAAQANQHQAAARAEHGPAKGKANAPGQRGHGNDKRERKSDHPQQQ